jgi:hypothetical protein
VPETLRAFLAAESRPPAGVALGQAIWTLAASASVVALLSAESR